MRQRVAQALFFIVLLGWFVENSLPAQGQTPEALQQDLIQSVDTMKKQTQVMVDMLYSLGELGFQEFETSRYVTSVLEKEGFTIERGVAGIPTAWVASWGSGKPVIGFIADIDCLPAVSQKPGVAYHAPLIDGAPGHGEGHNAGQAVNVTAAIALKRMMEKHHIPGTLRLYPGVAEELLAGKNYMVRAGLFKEVEALLGAHISDGFSSPYGLAYLALISAQFTFHGQTAHAANAPWSGRSALDAVELMDVGWNFRREHLRPEQRSHCVITDGGDQPNVVPDHAAIWYYFRETDFTRVQALHQIAQKIAQGAAMMTETQMSERVLSGTWSCHFNRVLAETQLQHMRQVGIPAWSEADQALAKALQKELGSEAKGLKTEVETFVPGKTPSGSGSDDIGDLSWNLPTCYLRFPGNISGLPGHSWANGVSMATPIAHKGATAGAKVQALTALDLLLQPELRKAVGAYFQEQTRETQWASLVPENSHPPIEMNQSTMEKFRPQLGKLRFDPDRYDTYLEQLGVRYPSLHQ